MMQQMLVGLGGLLDPVYVNNVFSTYIYSGNSGSQEINNGLDLDDKGGLVWMKARDANNQEHVLYDSERTFNSGLMTHSPSGEFTSYPPFSSWDNDGFTLNTTHYATNNSSLDYVAWSWRQAPGFFDVVSWSGSGTNNTNRRISHSLGSIPGTIIVKKYNDSQDWYVYHRSVGVDSYSAFNNTSAFTSGFNSWGTSPTSTDFGINEDNLSTSSGNYVAYVFAHDAAQFGTDRDKSIIHCGTYTGSSGTVTETCGFRPSWLMVKMSTQGVTGYPWIIIDTARNGGGTSMGNDLRPYSRDQETNNGNIVTTSSTGFTIAAPGPSTPSALNDNTRTFVYVAIAAP